MQGSVRDVMQELVAQGGETHISPDVMTVLRGLPGNNQCCDCGTFHNVQWSSVAHGIVLCLDCAGRHRILGVQVSPIKSLQMDVWEPVQVLYLLEGGNNRFKDTINKIDKSLDWDSIDFMDQDVILKIYLSSPVQSYRDRLGSHVSFLIHMQDEENSNSQDDQCQESDSLWPWASASANPLVSSFNHHLYVDSSGNNSPGLNGDISSVNTSVTFPDAGPLGMTLTKESHSGRAFVSKLVHGGEAHTKGVRVYDYVDEVNGIPTSTYQDTMNYIRESPRPLSLNLSRQITSSLTLSTPNETTNDDIITDAKHNVNYGGEEKQLSLFERIEAAVDASSNRATGNGNEFPNRKCVISSDFRVEFLSSPLGITVRRDASACGVIDDSILAAVVVDDVKDGGQAHTFGVKAGDCIIGINNDWVVGFDDFMERMKSLEYPLTLVLRRQNGDTIEAGDQIKP